MIKILFIGDIVGSIGRQAVAKFIPKINKKCKPDVIIANVENIAHGKGVTKATWEEVASAGVDFGTSGNHIFTRKETLVMLSDTNCPILRPANYPPGNAGSGEKVINISQKKFLLINLMGRIFMRETLDCPFRTFDKILERYKKENLFGVIVDFHAEATSEKKAFMSYVDGRALAVIGTHTHIPTADEIISAAGTASITDVGAVMANDSILGITKDGIINTFLNQVPTAHELPEKGLCEGNAVLIEIDDKKPRAKKITRLRAFINI